MKLKYWNSLINFQGERPWASGDFSIIFIAIAPHMCEPSPFLCSPYLHERPNASSGFYWAL